MKKLPRSFYLRPALTVARDLLGKYLCRWSRSSLLAARIVEVEAYLGSRDPASHAFRGRTQRNSAMFLLGGHLYVYFTYGMHFCANVVTGQEGEAYAVLLRAGEPVSGASLMSRRISLRAGSGQGGIRLIHELCNGPAKLCQAFGITRRENGMDLCSGKRIWIAEGRDTAIRIARTTRIGIREGIDHRWRFFVKGNPYVSRGRPVRSLSS